MTAPRRRVLELLLAAGEPVKAYDLIARYGADGQAAKPPTVYRALEFLERRGVVHRIASISAYVACASAADDARAHAAAFLICDCCGATEEVAVAGGEAFAEAAALAGYAIERTTIEGHGRCPACRVAA
jgi:Fur family zinc uptake transcriptional regulator